LERFSSRAFLDIELKVAGLEQVTIDALRCFPPGRGCFVSSFLPEVLETVEAIDPSVPLGLICDKRGQLQRCKDAPLQALFLHYGLMSEKLLGELQEANKRVFVWTVNRAVQMRALAAMGVDGIISDDTKLLAGTLAAF